MYIYIDNGVRLFERYYCFCFWKFWDMRLWDIRFVNCNSRIVRRKKKEEEGGGGKGRRRRRKIRIYLGVLNEFVVI